MNVGFVANWCNRGQGIVARQVRTLFEEAGHATYVLARPTNPRSPIGGFVSQEDVWDEPGVTAGSEWEVPVEEYVAWARERSLDAMFCDMNLQFEAVAAVRALGVKTIGRFVWERFGRSYVGPATEAFETIYSLTRAEQRRYREDFGIESPYVHWGLHPSLFAATAPKRDEHIWFIFHGGLQGRRKPIEATVNAFKAVDAPNIRLLIKAQGVRDVTEPVEIEDDPRIERIVDDLPYQEYHDLYSSCHVCLSPSRWEGLGLHLFESLAHGMPVISTDIPPINEVVRHGVSGLLARGVFLSRKSNGLAIFDPDPEDLSRFISELADPDTLSELTRTTREHRDLYSWSQTRLDYLALARGELEQLS